jgi:hypothetical protein
MTPRCVRSRPDRRPVLGARARPRSLPATIASVSRSKLTPKSKGSRLKALPWAALLQAAVVFGKRWRSLSEKERVRLRTLVRDSGGRLGNLSEKQRKELKRLAGKLELGSAARELVLIARGRRGRGRRR